MEPYVYKPLGQGEIRLLELHPNIGKQPLTGSILHVPLTSPVFHPKTADKEAHLEHPYGYDAISYTWGKDTRTQYSLVIDGDRTIGVTAHLQYVLQKIVRPDTSIPVWIDAVCINQADRDSEEKAQQIRLMPDIYRIARRVQIHLGPEVDDSPLAIKFLEHMAEYMEYLDESLNISNSQAYALALENGYAPPGKEDKTWNALRSFWLRPWFRRIWVVQELVNATDLVIYCGDLEIDWRKLWLAARVFQNNNQLMGMGLTMFTYHIAVDALEGANSFFTMADIRLRAWGYMSPSYMVVSWCTNKDEQVPAAQLGKRGLRPHERLPLRRDLPALQAYERLMRPRLLQDHAAGRAKFNFERPDMLEILNRTKTFLATDPVDRLYALLGLASDMDTDDPDFRIEYSAEQPPAKVCQRFAAGLIKQGQGAAVLGVAGTTRQACGTTSDALSWVPDWTTPIRPNNAFPSMNFMMRGVTVPDNKDIREELLYCAAGTSTMNARFLDEDRTLLVRGARIDTVLHIAQGQMFAPPHWYISILQALAGPGADTEVIEDALWRTLIANRTSKVEQAPPEFAAQYQAYKQRLNKGFGLAVIVLVLLFVISLPCIIVLARWVRMVYFVPLYTIIFFMGWDDSPLTTTVATILLRNYSIPVVLIGCCVLAWRAKDLLGSCLVKVDYGWQYFAGLVMAVNPNGPRYHNGPPECADFMQSFLLLAGRYNLGVTANGYIGLFPLAAKAGDEVAILEGGFTPFALRRAGDDGHYRLLGESFVHNAMKGELWGDARFPLEEIYIV